MSKRKTNFRDGIKLRGDLQIEVRHKGRARPTTVYAIKNTITYNGLNSALYLWSQDTGSPTDWQFSRLVPGTNGTPPSIGDTALYAPLGPSDQIVLVGANRTVSPSLGEIVVTGTLTLAQANGNTLREVGIQLGNGQLFARQVHPDIAKNGAITVSYTWRIATTS